MQSDKEPIQSTVKKISLQKKSIMMIDDSADILELGKLILEMHGYEVHTAPTGKEALTREYRPLWSLSVIACDCL